MLNRITISDFTKNNPDSSSSILHKEYTSAAALLNTLLTYEIISQKEADEYVAQYKNLSASEAHTLSIKIAAEFSLTEHEFNKQNFIFFSWSSWCIQRTFTNTQTFANKCLL